MVNIVQRRLNIYLIPTCAQAKAGGEKPATSAPSSEQAKTNAQMHQEMMKLRFTNPATLEVRKQIKPSLCIYICVCVFVSLFMKAKICLQVTFR